MRLICLVLFVACYAKSIRIMKELYPTPKTYDELEAQRKKQELLREKKRVTYPSVKISLFGATFAVGLTYFLSILNVYGPVPA